MQKDKIITLDIGASKIRAETVDENGNAGREYLTSLIGLELDNNKLVRLLVENIGLAIKDNPAKILAISIGVPGIVDQGIIKKLTNIKDVKDLDLIEKLRKEFNLPVFLLNDADAGALGEWWLGSGKGYKNLVYITLSSGVGSGVIIENKLQSQSELGHTPLLENEQRTCSCGKLNCAESFLGTKGLATTYANIFGIKIADMSSEEQYSISPAMKRGIKEQDPRWLKVQDIYSQHLSIFLKNITAKYQPEIIILGGGIAYGNEALLKNIQEKLNEPNIKLALAKFENSVNIGTARYAFEQVDMLQKGDKDHVGVD